MTTTVHWAKILAILWAIIGEFDNFGQICNLWTGISVLSSIMTFQSINWAEITFKSLNLMIQCHMFPLVSIGGSHCFFFQFWPPRALWFPVKSAVGGGIMINQKNAVGIIFFFFISAFKCNFGPICGL